MSGEKEAGGAAAAEQAEVKSEEKENEEWAAISEWFVSLGVEVQQLATLRSQGMETWGHVRHLQKQHLREAGTNEFTALMVMAAHEALSPERPRASTPLGRGRAIEVKHDLRRWQAVAPVPVQKGSARLEGGMAFENYVASFVSVAYMADPGRQYATALLCASKGGGIEASQVGVPLDREGFHHAWYVSLPNEVKDGIPTAVQESNSLIVLMESLVTRMSLGAEGRQQAKKAQLYNPSTKVAAAGDVAPAINLFMGQVKSLRKDKVDVDNGLLLEGFKSLLGKFLTNTSVLGQAAEVALTKKLSESKKGALTLEELVEAILPRAEMMVSEELAKPKGGEGIFRAFAAAVPRPPAPKPVLETPAPRKQQQQPQPKPGPPRAVPFFEGQGFRDCYQWRCRGQCKKLEMQECTAVHEPAKKGVPMKDEELLKWRPCTTPECAYGDGCVYKHGDGKKQQRYQQEQQAARQRGNVAPEARAAAAQIEDSFDMSHVGLQMAAIMEREAALERAEARMAVDVHQARVGAEQLQAGAAADEKMTKQLEQMLAELGRTGASQGELTAMRDFLVKRKLTRFLLQQGTGMKRAVSIRDSHPEIGGGGFPLKCRSAFPPPGPMRNRGCAARKECGGLLMAYRAAQSDLRCGPAVDTCANIHVVGDDLAGGAYGYQRVDPIRVDTVGGGVESRETCTMRTGIGDMGGGYRVVGTTQSLLSVWKLCEEGWEYRQDRRGARLRRPGQDDEGEWVWLEMRNGLPHVPVEAVPVAFLTKRMTRWQQMQQMLKELGEKGGVTGTDPDLTAHRKEGHSHSCECLECVGARLTTKPAKTKDKSTEELAQGWTLTFDLKGPMAGDIDGNKWIMIVAELKTKYTGVDLLQGKGAQGTLEAMLKFIREIKTKAGDKAEVILKLHSDAGNEFKGVFDKWCLEHGVTHVNTGGYRPQSNALVEGRIRRLLEKCRAMLATCAGGHDYYRELWGRCIVRACYLFNRVQWASGDNPYEGLTGKAWVATKDDHVFGALTMYKLPKEKKVKHAMEPSGDMGIWVGLSDTVDHGHLVMPIAWDPDTRRWVIKKTITAVSVKVYDDVFPLRLTTANKRVRALDKFMEKFNPWTPTGGVPSEARVSVGSVADGLAVYDLEAIMQRRVKKGAVQYLVKWKGYRDPSWEPAQNVVDNGGSGAVEMFEQGGQRTRGRSGATARAVRLRSHGGCTPALPSSTPALPSAGADEESCEHHDGAESGEASGAGNARAGREEEERVTTCGKGDDGGSAARKTQEDESIRRLIVTELMRKQRRDGDIEGWMTAFGTEWQNVKRRRLEAVPAQEADWVRRRRLAVRMRMILEQKKDGRRKGRLVLQGFMEPKWWSSGPTDSPVMATSAIRTIVFRARKKGMVRVLSSIDLDVAFLQANGFGPEEARRWVSFQPHPHLAEEVYRLTGPLYGSKDAGMRWYNTIAPWFVSQGFTQGSNDPCVFRHEDRDLVVGMHVDDLLVDGSQEDSEWFYRVLEERFECKKPTYLGTSGSLNFVGFRISGEVIGGVEHRFMDCEEDVEKFLGKVGHTGVGGYTSPMPVSGDIVSDTTKLGESEAAEYRSRVGSLNYYVQTVRFDLAHSVSRLGQFSAVPTVGAWKAMQRVISYLAKTRKFRIGGRLREGDDVYATYTDSDHAGDRVLTKRSQTGVLIMLNGVPVMWKSARQPRTSISSAVAEIYALSEGVIQGRLYLWRCEEMGMKVEWPFTIRVDNTQAIAFHSDTCINSKVRGNFDLRDEFVVELRDEKVVRVEKVDTVENYADVLTKCTAGARFNYVVGRVVGEGGGDVQEGIQ